MHTRRWVIAVACAAFLGGQAWTIAVDSPYQGIGVITLYALFGLAVVVQVVRSSRRGALPSRTIRLGLQALGQIQDMYLGRRPVPPVTYRAPEGVVAEETTSWTDPLDERTWPVGAHHPLRTDPDEISPAPPV